MYQSDKDLAVIAETGEQLPPEMAGEGLTAEPMLGAVFDGEKVVESDDEAED